MTPQDVPPPAVLTAHVRTAVDVAGRWLDRALRAGPGDLDRWDQSTFYARMTLMRALERGELLGWSLKREGAAATSIERVAVARAGVAYWGEAKDGLDGGLKQLRRLADASPTFARPDLVDVQQRLRDASEWLTALAEGLARTDERVQEPPEVVRALVPEQSLELDAM